MKQVFCPNDSCQLLLEDGDRAAGRCPWCGQTFATVSAPLPMNEPLTPPIGSAMRTIAGAILGVPVGGVTWGATGCCIGAAVMLLVRVIMSDHTFRGHFWIDFLRVSCGIGVLFGLVGIVVGGSIGGHVGRQGQPLYAATLRGSLHAMGVMAHNPFIVLPAVFCVAFMLVTYLADPMNWRLLDNLVFGGIGIVGGFLVLLALWFRAEANGFSNRRG